MGTLGVAVCPDAGHVVELAGIDAHRYAPPVGVRRAARRSSRSRSARSSCAGESTSRPPRSSSAAATRRPRAPTRTVPPRATTRSTSAGSTTRSSTPISTRPGRAAIPRRGPSSTKTSTGSSRSSCGTCGRRGRDAALAGRVFRRRVRASQPGRRDALQQWAGALPGPADAMGRMRSAATGGATQHTERGAVWVVQ